MERAVIKIGNSAGIIIPKSLRKKLKIREGEKLLVEEISGRDSILIRKKTRKSFSAFSVSIEFFSWLEKLSKRYASAFRELAQH